MKLNSHGDSKACFRSHMGMYAIEPGFGREFAAGVLNGSITPFTPEQLAAQDEAALYTVEDGVAIVHMDGPMLKHLSKFGGVSTNRVREMLRAMAADVAVNAALFVVDSPGGSIQGLDPLALELRELSRYLPTHVHVENLMASAALYFAAQANTISAAPDAEVGSIGVVMVVADQSQRYEKAGVKVHVISTGPLKGAGAEGAPITDEMLADWQGAVDKVNDRFIQRLAEGRDLAEDDVRALATGEVWSADKALEIGLIDGIASFDKALASLQAMHGNGTTRSPGARLMSANREWWQPSEQAENKAENSPAEKNSNKGLDSTTRSVSKYEQMRQVAHKMLGAVGGQVMNTKKVRSWLENTDEGRALMSELAPEPQAVVALNEDATADSLLEVEAGTLLEASDVHALLTRVSESHEKAVSALRADMLSAQNAAFAAECAHASGGALTPSAVLTQLEGASGDLLEERKKRMKSEAEKLAIKNTRAASEVALAATPREAFDALWESGRFGTTDETKKSAFWNAWIKEDRADQE